MGNLINCLTHLENPTKQKNKTQSKPIEKLIEFEYRNHRDSFENNRRIGMCLSQETDSQVLKRLEHISRVEYLKQYGIL